MQSNYLRAGLMATLALVVCILAFNISVRTRQHRQTDESTLLDGQVSVTISPAVSIESAPSRRSCQDTIARSPDREDPHRHLPKPDSSSPPSVAPPPRYAREIGHGRFHHHNYHASLRDLGKRQAQRRDPQQQEPIHQRQRRHDRQKPQSSAWQPSSGNAANDHDNKATNPTFTLPRNSFHTTTRPPTPPSAPNPTTTTNPSPNPYPPYTPLHSKPQTQPNPITPANLTTLTLLTLTLLALTLLLLARLIQTQLLRALTRRKPTPSGPPEQRQEPRESSPRAQKDTAPSTGAEGAALGQRRRRTWV